MSNKPFFHHFQGKIHRSNELVKTTKVISLFGRRLTKLCRCGFYHPVDERGGVNLDTCVDRKGKEDAWTPIDLAALLEDKIVDNLFRDGRKR
ncbi:MAG: hypothetical protein WC289_05825 [Patescibacteria group bacterium]